MASKYEGGREKVEETILIGGGDDDNVVCRRRRGVGLVKEIEKNVQFMMTIVVIVGDEARCYVSGKWGR